MPPTSSSPIRSLPGRRSSPRRVGEPDPGAPSSGTPASHPHPSNDTATEATAVSPSADLSITKTDSAAPVPPGTNLTYTLTVDNAGPSDAANVVVSDPVPSGTSFVSATGGGAESGGT